MRLRDDVKVSSLGLPAEMITYSLDDCVPEFALWDFGNLGYLTYNVSYLVATGQTEGSVGETFEASKMGIYTIEPRTRITRPDGAVHDRYQGQCRSRRHVSRVR